MSIRILVALMGALLLLGCNTDTSTSPQPETGAAENQTWTLGVRYVGGRLVPYGNGDIWVEQSAVTTLIPENPTRPPIVMIPGMGLAGSMYLTTPDGRKGWAQIFAEAGYPVYVYELPEYSTAGGFDINVFERIVNPLQANASNFGNPYVTPDTTPCETREVAGMGANAEARQVEVCPEPLAMDVKTPSIQVYPEANLAAWVGIDDDGNVWPDSRFPMDDYSTVQFEKSFPYRWNDNRSGIENFDYAPETGRGEAEALIGLYEEIGGPFIMLAHSAGTQNVEPFLKARPEAVLAVIGYEPQVLYGDLDEFVALMQGKAYASLYGDNVVQRGHEGRRQTNSVELVAGLQAAGITAERINLPERGIHGNSHMMAQDDNNDEIAQILIDWLNANVPGA